MKENTIFIKIQNKIGPVGEENDLFKENLPIKIVFCIFTNIVCMQSTTIEFPSIYLDYFHIQFTWNTKCIDIDLMFTNHQPSITSRKTAQNAAFKFSSAGTIDSVCA